MYTKENVERVAFLDCATNACVHRHALLPLFRVSSTTYSSFEEAAAQHVQPAHCGFVLRRYVQLLLRILLINVADAVGYVACVRGFWKRTHVRDAGLLLPTRFVCRNIVSGISRFILLLNHLKRLEQVEPKKVRITFSCIALQCCTWNRCGWPISSALQCDASWERVLVRDGIVVAFCFALSAYQASTINTPYMPFDTGFRKAHRTVAKVSAAKEERMHTYTDGDLSTALF